MHIPPLLMPLYSHLFLGPMQTQFRLFYSTSTKGRRLPHGVVDTESIGGWHHSNARVGVCSGSRSQSSCLMLPVRVAVLSKYWWPVIVGSFLKQHSQQLFHSFDIAAVIDRENHWVTFKYFHDDSHISLLLYRTLQPEYQYAHYLSEVKWFSNKGC